MQRLLGIVALTTAALLVTSGGMAGASDPSLYGIQSLSAGLTTTQAGAHPDFTTSIELKTDPNEPELGGVHPPYARTRDLSITVPPGLLGNPTNFPQCTTTQLEAQACPQDSQIGVTEVSVYQLSTFTEPVYLMKPESADVVARIGFIAGIFPTILKVRVRPEDDYGIEAKLENANAVARLVRADTTLWGVPAAKSHDPQRLTPEEARNGEPPPGGGRSSGLAPAPFMTNPTRCGGPREIKAASDSYQLPGQFSTASAPLPAITGCAKLTFNPQISLAPTTTAADSPSGIDVTLSLPQEGLRDPGVLATPHLEKAVVALPQGMTLNPASADGLGACTESQIGLVSESPIRFDSSDPTCPGSSKVGTAEIDTPVLPEPIQGSLYLASQFANPFRTLLSGYLVAQGQGVTVKLAGRFEVDRQSGQITAVFDENPEQPFEEFKLHFKDGNQGVLTTPNRCGGYSIQSTLSPWSAVDPSAPAPSEVTSAASPFTIDRGPNGPPCPTGSLAAHLTAGTTNPTAGAYSPFVLRLTRDDGSPRLEAVELTLPPGLTGKLAGIPYCSDSSIQAAAALGQPGQGGTELAAPSCPAASQIGTVSVGAGSGPTPFFVSTGRVYLAGPYKGAPLSMAIVTPAVAGPFDLGNVVVRTALNVDPSSTQITAVSDPLPTVLQGIPLDLRDVRVNLDRSGFTLNPTSCEPKAFSGFALTENGVKAAISERFQAASCASLGFKPRLALSLLGGAKRTGHPALKATLTARGGDANIGHTAVTLPPTEFIDQSHINNPCTRVQFNAGHCPPTSVLGTARAFSPLLDQPLEGPILFRSNGGERLLPDIVLDLRGQIHVIQVGFVDSKSKRVRTTFASVPDAPVSKIVINFKSGKEGLLVNSANLCAAPRHASVEMTGQNGRTHNFNPVIKTSCGKHTRRNRQSPRNAAPAASSINREG